MSRLRERKRGEACGGRFANVVLGLLALLVVWVVLSLSGGAGACQTAYALQPLDTQACGSITMTDIVDNKPVQGHTFSIYRVARATSNGYFVIEPAFESAGVSVDASAQAVAAMPWSGRAQALEAYVLAQAAAGDSLEPVQTGVTDASGTVTFEGLSVGLYLVLGDVLEVDNQELLAIPSLAAVPYVSSAGTWSYSVSLESKSELEPFIIPNEFDEPATTDIRVLKLWDDQGNEDARPQEVSVALYQDGQLFDAVTLSESNNWRYEWQGLSATAHWTLLEQDVPAAYSVSTVFDEGTFTVSNTYTGDSEEPDGSEDTPQNPVLPGGEEDQSTGLAATSSLDVQLPQTGQLWWPVAFALLGGVALCVLGWGMRKRAACVK